MKAWWLRRPLSARLAVCDAVAARSMKIISLFQTGSALARIFHSLAGRSCRRNWIVDARFAGSSALNSWAAQQHRPTDGVKILVMRPVGGPRNKVLATGAGLGLKCADA